MPPMSKTERISRQRMIRYLYEDQMGENDIELALRDKVPDAWHTLEHDLDVEEPKVKVTLRLDASVARFYRAMGQGYQARISRILGLWAHMKICDVLRLEEKYYAQMAQWNAKDREAEARGEEGGGFGTGVE